MQYADVRSRGLHAAPTQHKLARELSIKFDFIAISPICVHRNLPYIRPMLTLPSPFFFLTSIFLHLLATDSCVIS